ncbi:MAG: glycosyltransferase family 39 protein, partial [Lachnospiraceae bacterium]|nr:glycosyltransferase family 39 protein [Lachnospiraceae bacterium]
MKIKRINIPQWFFPVIILSVGALIRLVYLGSMPGGFHQDETFVALNAYDIYREGRDSAGLYMPVYMSSWGDGQSAMYIWLLSFLMLLTGGRWNIYLCRLPQALVAIFTILAVYFLMRRMFNRTAGLWAMFLL